MNTTATPDRLTDRLDALRSRCPELRFGQLVAIIGTLAEDETGHSLWDVEDADFAAALERFATDQARRGTPEHGGPSPAPAPLPSARPVS